MVGQGVEEPRPFIQRRARLDAMKRCHRQDGEVQGDGKRSRRGGEVGEGAGGLRCYVGAKLQRTKDWYCLSVACWVASEWYLYK